MPGSRQAVDAAPGRAAGSRVWSAPLVAIPAAALLTAVAGATEIPGDHLSASVFAGAVLIGLGDLPRLMWSPLALFGVSAAILFAQPGSRLGRSIRRGGLVLLCGLVVLHVYLGLRVDPAVAERSWLVVPFAGLGAVIAVWAIGLCGAWSEASLPCWRRRLAATAGPVLVAAAVGVDAANRSLLVDGYPAWHLGLSRAGFLLLAAGLASLSVQLGIIRRLSARPRSAAAAGIGLAVALLLVAALPVRSAVSRRTVSRYLRYTNMGASSLLVSDAARRSHRFSPTVGLVDPDGERTFARLSNLPPLPSGFALGDYNLLLISIEALRYRDTSLSGRRADLSPNLASFAAGGSTVSFARAFSPAPATLQVFASMFCMAPTSFTDVLLWRKWYGRLPDNARTVAEILADAGWWTFYAGHNHKCHFSRGGRIQGLHQGFAKRIFVSPPKGREDAVDADERIAAAAVRTLREASRSGTPFFGWVFFSGTHEPYLAHYPDMPGGTEHALYLQEVRYVDANLGMLLDDLRQSGLLERTVVVIHGDHGEAFREHGFFGHSDVYAETLHVPLVVRIPGMTGGEVTEPVSTSYVFPWLLERGPEPVREEALAAMRGRFGPAMNRTGGAVVAEQISKDGLRTALVAGDGYLVHDHPSGSIDIFDTSRDSRQKRDISDTAVPLVKEMTDRLEGWLEVREGIGVPLAEHIEDEPRW